MAHIDLPPLPGIAGLLAAHPHTAGPLNQLAEALLRGPSPLTPAQRETIAAHVSRENGCEFCARTHGAVARELGGADATDATLRSLLVIADRVRVDGRSVSPEDVAAAREAGADDRAIHDTVLIAAAFSMFNRYVDGLATALPADPADYDRHARALATGGYLQSPG
ncbi:putative carboxymuconolactone decarboxylase [Actinoplanes missouriensis 431]|uniref:Putative carboxymuconolactone decarboxylase n=1 Tax=Actinoplanes missouriensis (strain ATCC 14538 / DSM 43046 / CBS 188.64 / JCM 3121 / NBRC 102363 / NCIMB 12654 / NRRL B-3342 / UNCC 431) TaxID=512565 RepID=I0H4X3_ACTM4|nr:carboxymuconolactone decarboxylase family protein [Actinoplanes missouriensis]BAL88060.1 putative carboxymuconolactone decarboxylase [Actinoplanes missouriensis 431]